MKAYLLKLAIAFDQFMNALCNGDEDETLSSRAHRMRRKGQPVWGWTARVIDRLFFWQPGHCEMAWRYEMAQAEMLRALLRE